MVINDPTIALSSETGMWVAGAVSSIHDICHPPAELYPHRIRRARLICAAGAFVGATGRTRLGV